MGRGAEEAVFVICSCMSKSFAFNALTSCERAAFSRLLSFTTIQDQMKSTRTSITPSKVTHLKYGTQLNILIRKVESFPSRIVKMRAPM